MSDVVLDSPPRPWDDRSSTRSIDLFFSTPGSGEYEGDAVVVDEAVSGDDADSIAGDAAGNDDEEPADDRPRRQRRVVTNGVVGIFLIIASLAGWPSAVNYNRVPGGPAPVDEGIYNEPHLVGAVLGTWYFRTLLEAADPRLQWITRVAALELHTGTELFGHICYEATNTVRLLEQIPIDDLDSDAASILNANSDAELAGGHIYIQSIIYNRYYNM